MATKFTKTEIQLLRDEAWELKNNLGTKLSIAQDIIAKRHGYENWSLLMNAFNTRGLKQILIEELTAFINGLGDTEISRLFLNGTIWVHLGDCADNTIGQKSFQLLRSRFDVSCQEHTFGWECIIDLNGMPDEYMLETEIDEDEYNHYQLPILTIQKAKSLILQDLDKAVDCSFDTVMLSVEQSQFGIELES